ncbi:MAG: hypothetical protein QM820_07090 [Minicystis sp.]
MALLIVAGCRSDGARGHAIVEEMGSAPQGVRAFRGEVEQGATPARPRAERGDTTALIALAGSMIEARRAEGRMAFDRSRERPFREYAAETIAESEAQLAALRTLTAARDIDLAAAEGDPLLTTQREAAQRDLETLRGLPDAEVARVWIASEARSLTLLASIADIGTRAALDVATGNVFRMIAYDARRRAARATTIAAGMEDR